VEFIIFDRYTYDELANMNLKSAVIRAYVRFIMRLVPRPDISFLLDADPEAARARKPEYPIDFVRLNRQAYFDLDRLVGGLTIIPPMAIEEAKRQVVRQAAAILPSRNAGGVERKVEYQRANSANTDPALS